MTWRVVSVRPGAPYGLDASRVWVSVFREDDESYAIWRDDVGVPEEQIKRLDEAGGGSYD